MGWGFASLGFAPVVGDMSSATVRFVTGVVEGSEDSST